MLTVCIAGATGWTGQALVRGVREAPDLELRSAVSRSAAGGEIDGAPVYASAAEALDGVDVLVDFTSVEAVKANALAAIEAGVAVVIGTSGLTADDYADLDAAARDRGVGVVASGNFSLTAAMASAAALLAARHLPAWEVIDYASATKADVPSGTARELAERLGAARAGTARRARGAGADGPAARRGPRTGRGARRDGRRHPGPLRSPAGLRRLDRGRVRLARRAADDPPRRGRDARALCRRHAHRGPPRARARRPHPRARHAAAQLGAKPGTLVPSGGG